MENEKAIKVRISKTLYECILKIKEDLKEYGWNVVQISDADASAVLAEKIIDSKILKKN